MLKVAVIGDVIIDRYIFGTSSRLSPEAPIPIVEHKKEFDKIGGAGNLYENLKSLGVECDLLDFSEPKCIKTRVFSDGHYVTRIDQDYRTNGDSTLEKIRSIDFSKYSYVILSDYNKGVLDKTQDIIKHINKFNCKIIVDPKRDAIAYDNAWLIKPNKFEYEKNNFKSWYGNIIITDAGNLVTAKIEGNVYNIEPDKVDVSDVTGAGDSFLAAFVYGLALEKDYETCLKYAIKGATESVKHIGTYVLKLEDIEEKIIFTNGVFDILHQGHLDLLKEAKSLGHKLVVGINSDNSVKRLKGKDRPINDETARKNQLLTLPWVDSVYIFEEDTPYNLIKKIKPSLIVKGGDYTVDTVVGNDLAPVHIFPTVQGYSTTKIIEAIK